MESFIFGAALAGSLLLSLAAARIVLDLMLKLMSLHGRTQEAHASQTDAGHFGQTDVVSNP